MSGLSVQFFVKNIGITWDKFLSWKARYGKVNAHNGKIPRDHWLEAWEVDKILEFYKDNEENGYRAITYMMMDKDVVAVSAATTYRVLKNAGYLSNWNKKVSKKGTGYVQPRAAHQEWHIDVSHINIAGTFYYLTSVLDGYSRSIVEWDIKESAKTDDIEIVIQKALEKSAPEIKPRIISDNGPQFTAKEFKNFIRKTGMTHVRTSPYYPQSNGKLERFHKTLKELCIRPGSPISLDDAKRLVHDFVEFYNNERLHSSIGYITPNDKLLGNEKQIFEARDKKLEAARLKRKMARENSLSTISVVQQTAMGL